MTSDNIQAQNTLREYFERKTVEYIGFSMESHPTPREGVVETLLQEIRSQFKDEGRYRQFLHKSLALAKRMGHAKPGFSSNVKCALTASELHKEFHMWVNGEEDFHDTVVSAYKKRLQHSFQTPEGRRDLRHEAFEKFIMTPPPSAPPPQGFMITKNGIEPADGKPCAIPERCRVSK